jgi:hypothetical protein
VVQSEHLGMAQAKPRILFFFFFSPLFFQPALHPYQDLREQVCASLFKKANYHAAPEKIQLLVHRDLRDLYFSSFASLCHD